MTQPTADRPESPQKGPTASSLARVLADQGRRWRCGERALVESYLAREPALASNVDSALDLIYHEIVLREENGETVQAAEYLRRFPALTDQLKVLFEVERRWSPDGWRGRPRS